MLFRCPNLCLYFPAPDGLSIYQLHSDDSTSGLPQLSVVCKAAARSEPTAVAPGTFGKGSAGAASVLVFDPEADDARTESRDEALVEGRVRRTANGREENRVRPAAPHKSLTPYTQYISVSRKARVSQNSIKIREFVLLRIFLIRNFTPNLLISLTSVQIFRL